MWRNKSGDRSLDRRMRSRASCVNGEKWRRAKTSPASKTDDAKARAKARTIAFDVRRAAVWISATWRKRLEKRPIVEVPIRAAAATMRYVAREAVTRQFDAARSKRTRLQKAPIRQGQIATERKVAPDLTLAARFEAQTLVGPIVVRTSAARISRATLSGRIVVRVRFPNRGAT